MLYSIRVALLSVIFFSISSLHANCNGKCKPARADYVIVGVGTAGAVLAKKLSDDKKTSVIALHSGENLTDDPLIALSANSPITVFSALFDNPLYEAGETIRQVLADNRELRWVIALPEGGASSINAGAWVRGTDQLYSQWEAIAGPEWSVSRILSTFKKLENYNGQTTNSAVRGHHGPIDVRQVPNPSICSQKFTQAEIAATGFPFVLDYNDPNTPIGVSSQLQYTQNGPHGEFRVSSATAFLNEKVMTPEGIGVNGRKLRVLFDSKGLRAIWKGNKAIGVEFLRNGKNEKVYARKGVIVCAGLNSSPFLMHSGVGPRALLEGLEIPVIFDNPNVGQGLVDQPGILTFFTANPNDTSSEFMGIFNQIAFLPAPGGDPTRREVRMAMTNLIPGFAQMIVDLVQSTSRGSVTIKSPDPLDPPVIDLGFLSDADLTLYQEAFQVYVKATNTQLQSIDPQYELIFPDPAIIDDITLLTEFIKENVMSNQSFQSHCRMAPQDQGGVVDSTGHVYGVENLIVADDSVVPIEMDGATMASAYLIAANIARMLLGL